MHACTSVRRPSRGVSLYVWVRLCFLHRSRSRAANKSRGGRPRRSKHEEEATRHSSASRTPPRRPIECRARGSPVKIGHFCFMHARDRITNACPVFSFFFNTANQEQEREGFRFVWVHVILLVCDLGRDIYRSTLYMPLTVAMLISMAEMLYHLFMKHVVNAMIKLIDNINPLETSGLKQHQRYTTHRRMLDGMSKCMILSHYATCCVRPWHPRHAYWVLRTDICCSADRVPGLRSHPQILHVQRGSGTIKIC